MSNAHIIRFKAQLDAAGQRHGDQVVEFELTPATDADNALGGILRTHFEVEILRGQRYPLDNGSTYYCFTLDEVKAAKLRQAMLTALFQNEPYYPIQPN